MMTGVANKFKGGTASGPEFAFYNAFGFDGVGDSVDIANNSSWYLANGDKTTSVWFRTSGTSEWIVHSQGSSITTDTMEIYLDGNGHFVARCLDNSAAQSWIRRVATNYSDDIWHCAIVYWDSFGTGRIVIDGAAQATVDTTTGTITSITPTSVLRLGDRIASDFPFSGSITALSHFSGALTVGEEGELHNDGNPLIFGQMSASLRSKALIYLEMSSNDNTLTDLSSTGNDGTAVNGVTSDGELIEWQIA
mgnify:CR=1 FL=1